jgi:hypothetical protein
VSIPVQLGASSYRRTKVLVQGAKVLTQADKKKDIVKNAEKVFSRPEFFLETIFQA